MAEILNLKESVLQEAHRLINGPRAVVHGAYDENFKRAAAIFNAWKGKEILTPIDMNMAQQCLKMSREELNPEHRDNLVDQPGYIGLRAKMRGLDK